MVGVDAGCLWRRPLGPHSSITGLMDHPVVHVAYEDAEAYASRAGEQLSTEAEWEYAARGGLDAAIFTWATRCFRAARLWRIRGRVRFPGRIICSTVMTEHRQSVPSRLMEAVFDGGFAPQRITTTGLRLAGQSTIRIPIAGPFPNVSRHIVGEGRISAPQTTACVSAPQPAHRRCSIPR